MYAMTSFLLCCVFGGPPFIVIYANAAFCHSKIVKSASTGVASFDKRAAADGVGRCLPSAPDGLVRDLDTALGKKIFDVSVAEREAEIQPDGMLNDGRREARPAVRVRSHLQG
jgi:hypothetical protein